MVFTTEKDNPDLRLLQPSLAGDPVQVSLFKIIWAIKCFDLNILRVYDFDNVDNRAIPVLIEQLSCEEFITPNMIEPQYRELLKSSIELHRRKGTEWSVIKALEISGAFAHIREWWQNPNLNGVKPHTFEVIFYGDENDPINMSDPEWWDRLLKLVESSKPVRSAFNMAQGIRTVIDLGTGGALRSGSIMEIKTPSGAESYVSLGIGGLARSGVIMLVNPTINSTIPPLPTGLSWSNLNFNQWSNLTFSQWAVLQA